MSRFLLCVIILGVCSFAFADAPAAKKADEDPWDAPVTLEIKDTSAANAIETLFRGKKLNYSISADLQGIVIPTLQISQIPMRQALQSLLKAARAEYRIENNVAIIEPSKPWSTKVSVDFKDTPLREALDELAKKAGAPPLPVSQSVPNPKITYSASDQSYISIIRALAKLSGAKSDGHSITVGDPMQKIIDMDFKDTPLPDAIGALLKETGISYTVDPGIQQLKVTAVLKSVTLMQAFNQVVRASGAVWRTEKGVYQISPKPTEVSTQATTLPGPPGYPAADSVSETIELKYVDSSSVAPLLTNNRDLTVTALGTSKIRLSGSQKAISSAKDIIAAVDDESSFPRIVRLKMAVKVTVHAAKGSKTYDVGTESVGPDRSTMLLSLSAQTPYMVSSTTVTKTGQKIKQSTPNFISAPSIYVYMMPTINPDGSISLAGKGVVSVAFGSPIPSEIDKDFDATVSATPGQPVVVAAGSATTDQGKAEFTVTVTATVEKGRARAIGLLQSIPPSGMSNNNHGPAEGGYGGQYGNNQGYGGTPGYGQSNQYGYGGKRSW